MGRNKIFVIRSGKIVGILGASNKFQVVKKFIRNLDESDISKIGILMEVIEPDSEERYIFATPELLLLAGKIDIHSAVDAIVSVTGCSQTEAVKLLATKINKAIKWWTRH